MDSKRYRNFCLMTYLQDEQILQVLGRHERQLKAYAYIAHNKDVDEFGKPKIIHRHLLISLVNNTTVDALRNWFKGFEDENGKQINTLAQPMHEIIGSFDYLTHETEQAIAEGKYQYPKENIKGFNLDFFTDSSKAEQDNLSLAVSDMCAGVPIVEVMKRYGRDFITHYGHIRTLFNDIQKQIGGQTLE